MMAMVSANTKLEKADTESALQKRKQQWQYKIWK